MESHGLQRVGSDFKKWLETDLIVIFFPSEYFQGWKQLPKDNVPCSHLEHFIISQMNLLGTLKSFGDLEGVRPSSKDNSSFNIPIPTKQAACMGTMMNLIII